MGFGGGGNLYHGVRVEGGVEGPERIEREGLFEGRDAAYRGGVKWSWHFIIDAFDDALPSVRDLCKRWRELFGLEYSRISSIDCFNRTTSYPPRYIV